MKVLTVLGTRPEAVKLASVIKELERQGVASTVCLAAQHRDMLDPFVQFFHIHADYDLAIMRPDQTLYHVTTEALLGMRRVLESVRPDVVIVQGDTATAFAAALAAYYEKIPVAHVEAGLRTGRKYSPFPEEMNRRLIDHLSEWLFAPTEHARENLRAEGLPRGRIFVTGNTVVDALHMIVKDERFRRLKLPIDPGDGQRLILVTAHRRESFGRPLEQICRALRRIAQEMREVEIVYPVHLNPNVHQPVHRLLGKEEQIHLLEPLDYLPFLKLMERSTLILTDSGGIQEEAPSLAKPVLVLRQTTERPEAVAAGVARLVGTEENRIVEETLRLLADPIAYQQMVAQANPFGDGRAAERIVQTLKKEL